MLSQSRFTSQPTFQLLSGFGFEVAQGLHPSGGARLVCLDGCLLDVFTWKEAREPVEGLFVFHLGCSRRKQKAEQKLV